MVNSTLIARGESARHSIGSASVCEFFVTIAVSVTFLFNLDLDRYATIVLGLIGGALAAPMAGWFSRVAPTRPDGHGGFDRGRTCRVQLCSVGFGLSRDVAFILSTLLSRH